MVRVLLLLCLILVGCSANEHHAENHDRVILICTFPCIFARVTGRSSIDATQTSKEKGEVTPPPELPQSQNPPPLDGIPAPTLP